MKVNEIEKAPELQQVLWACYKYWQSESLPPDERAICFRWVVRLYQDKFGVRFHQYKLRRLTELGFLKEDDTSRGGHRRYYKILDPNRVADLLVRWSLI